MFLSRFISCFVLRRSTVRNVFRSCLLIGIVKNTSGEVILSLIQSQRLISETGFKHHSFSSDDATESPKLSRNISVKKLIDDDKKTESTVIDNRWAIPRPTARLHKSQVDVTATPHIEEDKIVMKSDAFQPPNLRDVTV